jgi:hypothetical protein
MARAQDFQLILFLSRIYKIVFDSWKNNEVVAKGVVGLLYLTALSEFQLKYRVKEIDWGKRNNKCGNLEPSWRKKAPTEPPGEMKNFYVKERAEQILKENIPTSIHSASSIYFENFNKNKTAKDFVVDQIRKGEDSLVTIKNFCFSEVFARQISPTIKLNLTNPVSAHNHKNKNARPYSKLSRNRNRTQNCNAISDLNNDHEDSRDNPILSTIKSHISFSSPILGDGSFNYQDNELTDNVFNETNIFGHTYTYVTHNTQTLI